MRTSLGSGGVFNDIKQLYDALRVMAPDHDWSWLKILVWRLHRQVTPKAKKHRMVSATRLLDLGLGLMETADLDRPDPGHHQALQYRDGLLIALLILRPLRRRTLAAITLGETLLRTGDGYALVFGPEHCKNKRPLEFPWPEVILPQLEHYLAAVRPLFPGADEHQGLWASCKGRAMTEGALYKQLGKRTSAAFGEPINLHLFRDIAAIHKRLNHAGIKIVTLSEGEINELHVGLKGTMNALFLKDLAQKTRRGQRGRVEAGKIPGGNSYGYRMLRELQDNGSMTKGEREIDEREARIVRRIFKDYATGTAPRRIAAKLNLEGIPSPRGGQWNASTINGSRQRRNGILNNELYIGRITYNRQRFVKDPER